jgi:hypothetical protein
MSQPAWSAGATELPVPYSGGAVEADPVTGGVGAHYRHSAYGVDLVLGAGAADVQRFAGRLELSGGLVLMGARELTGVALTRLTLILQLGFVSARPAVAATGAGASG